MNTKKTELTKQEKMEAAFEIMSDGILYKPKGCKMTKGNYKNGCGKCGSGNHNKCIDNKLK